MSLGHLRRMGPSSQGFSLVEIMTVIAIMAILSAFAGYSGGFIESYRVRNAGVELFSDLQLARSEAIKRNLTVTVTATGGDWSNGWTATWTNSSDEPVTVFERGELNGMVLAEGSALTSIQYLRTGRLSGAALPKFQIDVSATASDHVRCLRIDLSGMPQLTRGACS